MIMGLVGFRWRLLLMVVAVILFWQFSKTWLTFLQEESVSQVHQVNSQVAVEAVHAEDDNAKEKVHLSIYYETLCPDSRSFFIKQLVPTYSKLKENLQVEFVPYGKAMTKEVGGDYEFTCQHGQTECEGNIIHACAIDTIKGASVLLNYLSCMIKNNLKPVNIMNACAQDMHVDRDSILKCSLGRQGRELLARYGELTEAVRPTISFIPTIVINNSSDDQAKILKNLLQEVCSKFKDKPKGCML